MPRLPTSLHWLIEKRGRIDGSIKKIELYLEKNRREFEKYQDLTNELSLLRDALASVDKTLQLHKIKIEPELIPTINGHNHVTGLKHGELTQFILDRLRLEKGLPVPSNEIVDFILTCRNAQGLPPIVRVFLTQSVQRRIKSLYAKGIVVRHHRPSTGHYGRWSLPLDAIQDIQTADDDLGRSP